MSLCSEPQTKRSCKMQALGILRRAPAARKKWLFVVQLSLLHPPGSWGSSGLPPFRCRTIVV